MGFIGALPKRIIKSGIKSSVTVFCQSSAFRGLLVQSVFDSLAMNHLASLNWNTLDPAFTACRRQLFSTLGWRYGTPFVKTVATRTFRELSRHGSIEGKVYCDVGCGRYHPYGISAVMYINGAASTIAIDLQSADVRRAAEALYDLLVDCLAHPEDWHLSSISREEYVSRIYQFNLKALRVGNLLDGLANTPLQHIITDIHHPSGIQPESIDLMSSTAVLEHFLNFKTAAKQLHSLMSPGGIACHAIDLMDHRMYNQPNKYNWWSFLAEEENWSDGSTNRLRTSEIRSLLESAGFEILRYDGTQQAELPADFGKRFKGRFSKMSEEELCVTRVDCVLRKPRNTKEIALEIGISKSA